MIHPTPSSNNYHASDSIVYSDWQAYSYERAGAVKFIKLMCKLFGKNPAKFFSYDHRVAGFYRRAGSNIEIRTRITTTPGGKIPGPSEIWPPGFQVDVDKAQISIHHDPTVSDSVHITGVALVNNKI